LPAIFDFLPNLLIIIPMHEFVSFNGQLITASDAAVPAISAASLYGKGIFTTIAVYDGEPFLWDKHWIRLAGSAAKLGIDISDLSKESVRWALDETLAKNNVLDGRARITIFDISSGDLWSTSERKSQILIKSAELRIINTSFLLTVSPFAINSQSPLTGVKSCNYLDNLLAFDGARTGGFDEAIRLNERGEIVSACMANVFWQKDDRLFTPSLKTGCLPGTTREYLLECLECSEVEQSLDSISNAEAMFLTSAGIGIVEVSEFDGRALATANEKITGLLPR
jgi:branched-chain amino acid aminotransferase